MSWTLLLSLLVKSSLVAGGGLACARLLKLNPGERVDILRATVCLLLALPVIMAVMPAVDVALLPPLPAAPTVFQASDFVLKGESSAWAWPPSGETLGAVWLFGVILIAGRLMLGLRTLTRWTRQGAPVTCPAWLAPIEDLAPVDRPRLVCSDRVDGPLSWGVAPGSILVDPATLEDRRAASAIMAHELAHLRRHDWLFLVLSRVALAMFWFNPLVWRLHAVLAERSEEAADAAALKFVDRAAYARTLVRLASVPVTHRVPGLATAMAADARTLKTRIACIMSQTSDRRRPTTLALTVVALAAVATPLAALGVSRQAAPTAPGVPPVPVAAPAQPVQPAQAAKPAEPAATARPAAVTHVSRSGDGVAVRTTEYRFLTPEEQAEIENARVSAEQARALAEEARRTVEAHRGEIEAAARQAAEQARLQVDWARVASDRAREAAERAREAGDRAREAGERARQAGERARAEAERQMIHARAQMANGAEQMHRGARQMREEAARLRDPAYRALQIEKARARGDVVTDAELRDLAGTLPGKADDLDRNADRLAEKAARQAS